MTADNTWLDPARWSRLRAALDDGVPCRDISRRFGLSLQVLAYVREARTLDEARATLSRHASKPKKRRAG